MHTVLRTTHTAPFNLNQNLLLFSLFFTKFPSSLRCTPTRVQGVSVPHTPYYIDSKAFSLKHAFARLPPSSQPANLQGEAGCGVVGNGFMDHWPCNIFVFVVCFCHFVADVCACDVRPVHLSKLLYFCFALLFALLYVCLSFFFPIFFNCFVLKLRVLTPSSKLLAQKIK